jgi:PTH1 family peptidyl-tRNA hydrolase
MNFTGPIRFARRDRAGDFRKLRFILDKRAIYDRLAGLMTCRNGPEEDLPLVLVGLGNPGSKYEKTRHNLGFAVLDRLVSELTLGPEKRQPAYRYRVWRHEKGEAILVWPETFVNRSGEAVRDLLTRYGVSFSRLFVITDDYQLPLGRIRMRRRGSSGGHNGLESIIDEIGSENFPRLRGGIGPLPEEFSADPERIPEFVLDRFSESEGPAVAMMIERACEALKLVVKDRFDLAISRYNGDNPIPEE